MLAGNQNYTPQRRGADQNPLFAKNGNPMIHYSLEGKAALVTGGASGIGLATAEILARAGARVAINYLPSDERGPQEVERLRSAGWAVSGAPGDIGQAGEAEAMVQQAIADLGRLDLLVNNAGTPGVTRVVPAPELDLVTEEVWNKVLGTNLLGLFRCARAAAPTLKAAQGAIVNTASIAGMSTTGSSMAYGASKAGVISLTKNLARALAPQVRVNAVAPGFVTSPWELKALEARMADTADCALLKRVCSPEDIAEVIVFLGIGAAMVTGQTLVIDGGFTLADPRHFKK
jgi:3-oxoacyl-[acyl-carrier protein] reductase